MNRRQALALAVAAPAVPAVVRAAERSQGVVTTADGVRLFVRDWGAGPPIVFAASWSLPSESWSRQMAALAAGGFRVVAYDRRGHGRSDDPGRGYDFDTLADDLVAVLDSLDLAAATLVGFSMAGGEIVRALARGARPRTARIVLIGTTTPCLERRPDHPDGIPAEVFEAFRTQELARDFPQWVEDNLVPFAPTASRPTLEWVRTMALGASLDALIGCHRAITGTDFRAEMAAIDTPALLLHGAEDQTSPPALTALPSARLLKASTLVLVEAAPHGLPFSHADLVTDRIASFARG